jgi:hypothetical protein
MANTNAAQCESARNNLDKLQRERFDKENTIGRLEERVAVTRGEISVAENTLSSIQEAARNGGTGVVGLAVGIATSYATKRPSDAIGAGTALAIQLANEEARQKAQLAGLRHKLQNEERQLQAERRLLTVIQAQSTRVHNYIDANGCR